MILLVKSNEVKLFKRDFCSTTWQIARYLPDQESTTIFWIQLCFVSAHHCPFFILCCLTESPSNNRLTYTKQNKYRYFVWGLTVLTVIQRHVNSRYGVLLRCLTLEALEALSSLRNAYLYTECVAQVEQGCFAQRDNSHWCLDSISALYIYKFVAELLICLGLWKWDYSFYIKYA